MSPAFQGIDRAVAPPPATAKKMLDTIDGRWWNVYIGGPESGGHGWSPSLVREYVRHGIDRFMLTYVGRQWDGPLTRAQGQADARDALAIAKSYGYTGDFPLCLDVELRTFNTSPSKSVEYARAWCQTVRKSGTRPGVYANPAPLIAMAKAKVPADFVWVASWVSTTASPRDPHDAKGMPVHLWGKRGQRAWQYAGIIGGRPCNILGLNVDINVADLGCLAPPPGGVATPAIGPKRPRPLRRGGQGATVVRLTHRLSVLKSRRTGHPYLDGPRKRFDAETETALKAFQAEHELPASGTYGKPTAIALLKAVKRAKEQKQLAHQAGSNGAKAEIEPTRLPALVKDFKRLDEAADRAWQRIEAYGRRRRRLVAHAKAVAESEVTLADVTASLARIEKQLETIVELERREAAAAEEPVAAGRAVAAYGGPTAAGESYGAATVEPAAPAGAVTAGSYGAASNGEPPRRALPALSDIELDRRIDRLDRRLDEARKVRIARYARVDKALLALSPVKPVAKPGGVTPKPGAAKPKPDGVKPKPDGVKPKPGDVKPKPQPGPDMVVADKVRSLQRNLNRFVERYLDGMAPIAVDGKKGPETNRRIRTVKYYLGYGGDERRSATVKPAFLRRLLHPHSPRASSPAMLARAARRRKKQRKKAQRVGSGPIEGSPKQVIDSIVLPICRSCGIPRTPADNDAANARHGPTVTGSLSDHQGPPARAWAADMSNGGSPTPEMDKLARELAKRFDIPWTGAGLGSATHGGYRFQVIYRTNIGGNHFNHVHFGVKDV